MVAAIDGFAWWIERGDGKAADLKTEIRATGFTKRDSHPNRSATDLQAHCNFLFMSTLPQVLRLDDPSGRSTGVESTSNNFYDFRPASATMPARSGRPPAERGRRQPPTRATPFSAPISKRRLSHTPRTFLSPGESTTSILATPLLAPTWGIRVLKAKRPNEIFPVLHFDAPANKGEQAAQPIQAPVGAKEQPARMPVVAKNARRITRSRIEKLIRGTFSDIWDKHP